MQEISNLNINDLKEVIYNLKIEIIKEEEKINELLQAINDLEEEEDIQNSQ